MSGFQNVEPFVPDEPCGCIGGVPTITSLVPASVDAGSGAFTLTVNGTNFRPDSIVKWNGSPRTTTFVNNMQVTAAILAADVLVSGTATITVFNPPPECGPSTSVLNVNVFTILCVGALPTIT